MNDLLGSKRLRTGTATMEARVRVKQALSRQAVMDELQVWGL